MLADAEGRKEGSFHVVDGQIVRVTGGRLAPVRQHKELAALIGLRDLGTELLAAESNVHTPSDQIAPLRRRTLAAYDEYVSRFGNLNRGTLAEGAVDEETGLPGLSWRRPAMGGFRRDPDTPLVMALETFDQDTGEAGPAPILLHRVNRLPDPIERVDTPAEALAVSLGESGQVDLDRIAGLLGLDDADAARQSLGDLVFDDPSTRRPVAAAEYLSGNVRQKLEEARAAGIQRNIAALEAALPRELGPLDIRINLGSPFALTVDIEAFLREEMGVRWPRVTRVAEQGVWEVDEATSDPTAQMQFGTADAPITYLVECALNARMPEITDRTWNSDRQTWVSVRNVQKSAAANEKLALIRDRFTTWVWEDEVRATRICTDYNRKLNSHVTRVFDGSGLTFPGIASGFTPWPHQRAAVERIVSSPRALLAHPVGAGKSAEMVMGARTLRQFGLANKPLIVVPNHLLEQIAREAQQTFPTGRFLIASKDDLARDARRLFAARCATGDWDAVIMTHSAFTSIPVHPDAERAWLNEQKHRLRRALEGAVGGRREKGPKAVARAIRALEARTGKLRSNALTDEGSIWFEQLGVDYIMVDEAHLFRRLDLGTTNRDSSGMGSGSSKRATDLLVKIETLAARRPVGAPVVSLFTGTPWSNTLAETWVWQRYLQPSTLDDVDLLAFDAWVSAFIRYETNIEVSPDGGGFRMQRRPVGVVNAPELKTMLAQVADIIDPESLGLHRPAYTVETVVVDPTPEQRMFVRGLAARADAIRNKVADKRATRDGGETDDSMLLVCNDGRKVALDPRLVGIDEESAKILKLAELIADAHHANARRAFGSHPAPGNFQLVFLDLGTPKPGESQTYGRLRRHLVDLGVPAQRIRFVHEATTDKARAALFASCRDGEVAVLIGSTSKVGMGTNVQTRLTHLWHADAPWLPSDVIQRDGRAVRPGNLSEHVTITRVVTEGTFDAYTWQALERKSRSFDALYATGATAREIEDVSGATISYGEVKALASGNPLLLEQAEASAEVAKLRLMQSVHLQSVKKAKRTASGLDERAVSLRAAAERGAEVLASLTEPQEKEREALLAAVGAWREAERNVNGYGLSYAARVHARWRGTELRPTHENDRLVGVTIVHRYTSIHTLPLAPKTLRRGAPQVTETIAKLADRWLDDLSARIADWRRTADECAAQAEEARYAAATTSFPDEGKLRAAVTRLARIDAQIQADVEAPTRVAA
ncbi:helicase-related protein [Microbacterium enclense]|uniref:helicase-related protein n=1 Tax=Microbacterium enclense TaxID=993073 RepID=UPI003F814926